MTTHPLIMDRGLSEAEMRAKLEAEKSAEVRAAQLRRNIATDEGRELGKHLARFCDEAEPKARRKMPQLQPRCYSCAFRSGEHHPNGSPTTLMDAVKCLAEGHEFYCHEPARAGQLCSGWAMMMLADDDPKFVTVPWQFSDESIPTDGILYQGMEEV